MAYWVLLWHTTNCDEYLEKLGTHILAVEPWIIRVLLNSSYDHGHTYLHSTIDGHTSVEGRINAGRSIPVSDAVKRANAEVQCLGTTCFSFP